MESPSAQTGVQRQDFGVGSWREILVGVEPVQCFALAGVEERKACECLFENFGVFEVEVINLGFDSLFSAFFFCFFGKKR
ncbi:MAG: hypothetical protein IPM82_04125 [Saprospiraceae bacterium]|nr:hypothetical protein [Saprospiraceae bacterium]